MLVISQCWRYYRISLGISSLSIHVSNEKQTFVNSSYIRVRKLLNYDWSSLTIRPICRPLIFVVVQCLFRWTLRSSAETLLTYFSLSWIYPFFLLLTTRQFTTDRVWQTLCVHSADAVRVRFWLNVRLTAKPFTMMEPKGIHSTMIEYTKLYKYPRAPPLVISW